MVARLRSDQLWRRSRRKITYISAGQLIPSSILVPAGYRVSSTAIQPIAKSVGVNIGVKLKNSRPRGAEVAVSESSLVGPVGPE